MGFYVIKKVKIRKYLHSYFRQNMYKKREIFLKKNYNFSINLTVFYITIIYLIPFNY